MKKNGFTLVELLVSITLLSIVLVFMMNTLVKLRDTNIAEGIETNLLVGQAMISNEINSDLLKNGGLADDFSCPAGDELQTMILNFKSNKFTKISIEGNNNSIIKYTKCFDENCNNTTLDEKILTKKIGNGYKYEKISCNKSNGLTKIEIKIIDVNNNEIPKYSVEILDY